MQIMGYMIVDKIAHIRLLCKKVLPAVYDESLSYMEGLAKLTFKLNETITSVNALNDNVETLNDSVIDLNNRVTNVENTLATSLDNLQKELDAAIAENNAKVDAKLAEVDAELVNVDARVTALEQGIDDRFNGLEARINKAIKDLTVLVQEELNIINEMYVKFEQDMKDYVEEEIRKALENIPDLTNIYVIDPTTGELSKVQYAINNIFIFSAYNAFTVDEWNELGMSVSKANSIMVKSIPRGLTIYEWLHDAKRILLTQVLPSIAEKFAYPHTFVFDYLSGTKVWHDRNVDINQQLIAASGCYCCDELVTIGFSCDEIIGFNLTYFDYVMRANKLMTRA